jgi:hypothetical protein
MSASHPIAVIRAGQVGDRSGLSSNDPNSGSSTKSGNRPNGHNQALGIANHWLQNGLTGENYRVAAPTLSEKHQFWVFVGAVIPTFY